MLLYGRQRDARVLDEILPREAFQGIGVSDDYAVYRNRFSKGQKCWAHLLRKAIKLMLGHDKVKVDQTVDNCLELQMIKDLSNNDKHGSRCGFAPVAQSCGLSHLHGRQVAPG